MQRSLLVSVVVLLLALPLAAQSLTPGADRRNDGDLGRTGFQCPRPPSNWPFTVQVGQCDQKPHRSNLAVRYAG